MERNKRLYPIDEEQFNKLVVPIIEASYIGKGRPPKVTRYEAFCGILVFTRLGKHHQAAFPKRNISGSS